MQTRLPRHVWPRVVIVSYFMLRMLADSIGKGDWKAVSHKLYLVP